MAIPVDVLSYTLGLFTSISFSRYLLATFIGVIPFAFFFAYAAGFPTVLQVISAILAIEVLIIGYKRWSRVL